MSAVLMQAIYRYQPHIVALPACPTEKENSETLECFEDTFCGVLKEEGYSVFRTGEFLTAAMVNKDSIRSIAMEGLQRQMDTIFSVKVKNLLM